MRRIQWSFHLLAIGSGLTLGLTAPLTAVLAMELGAGSGFAVMAGARSGRLG